MADTKKKTRGRRKLHKDLNGRVEMRMAEARKQEWQEKAEEHGYKSLTKWIYSLVEAA